jgi:hypothetical protein
VAQRKSLCHFVVLVTWWPDPGNTLKPTTDGSGLVRLKKREYDLKHFWEAAKVGSKGENRRKAYAFGVSSRGAG